MNMLILLEKRKVEFVRNLHAKVRANIEKKNEQYAKLTRASEGCFQIQRLGLSARVFKEVSYAKEI